MKSWVYHMIEGLKQMKGFKMWSQPQDKWKWNDLFILPKWWSIVVWAFAILIYLTFNTCGTYVHQPKPSTYKAFPLIDSNNRLHKFDKEYNIGLYDESIMYCVEHHKWVSVRGIYKKSNGVGKLEAGSVKTYSVREKGRQW